jgi:DtxR family transcriptional regulator, Mn-dependent transcriptional regulator
MPSATLEEYLESIYKIAEHGEVRPTQIAEALGVSGPTVTATLQRLEKAGLVVRPGGGVELTDEGRSQAVSIIRRHRLAEVFLHEVLALPWDVVHDEACRWEHALSPQVADALEAFLQDPQRCPHGHAIPHADGTVMPAVGIPLSEARAGRTYLVAEVDERGGEEFLAYLGGLGLFPGTEFEVVEVAPFDGPITMRIGAQQRAIGRDPASRVSVVAT